MFIYFYIILVATLVVTYGIASVLHKHPLGEDEELRQEGGGELHLL